MNNRCIVVTGSAGGIGRAAVEHFRGLGAKVIGVDIRDADLCYDLSLESARQELIQRLPSVLPQIDTVVAAAGILSGPPAKVLSVNFFGATRLLSGLRPILAAGVAPRALVLSSTASRYPCDSAVVNACLNDDEGAACGLAETTESNAYAISKAALSRWVRRHAVAREWGGAGILLNAIAPGTITDTGMTRPMLDSPGGAERLQKLVPSAIGRFGTPDDMARLIGFLGGPDNGYVTGQVIFADGGSDALQRGDGVW